MLSGLAQMLYIQIMCYLSQITSHVYNDCLGTSTFTDCKNYVSAAILWFQEP